VAHTIDLDLDAKDISGLSSADAVAGFLTKLGYPTGVRKPLTASSLGVSADTERTIRNVELMAADDYLRVLLVQVRSLTARTRTELANKLGQTGSDHLIILAADFNVLEFVLVDKRSRPKRGPAGGGTVQIIPRTVTVHRKTSMPQDRRVLRRLTWTGHDGVDQYDKLRAAFESAPFASRYFQNKALFSDHYLYHRLPECDAWRENPVDTFTRVSSLLQNARKRWSQQPERQLRDELYEPVWSALGFTATVNKEAARDTPEPDYLLRGSNGQPVTAAFCYRWGRWLDGPGVNDPDTPEENPGAAVVSALTEPRARWVIVTNGKLWRLYSRDAHSRATNYYEVDLEEALAASAETDPNEAFRYWWLFFRQQAFAPADGPGEALPEAAESAAPEQCWLDRIVAGSRDYARNLGERLKDRVFKTIFPLLAQGFLEHRRQQGRRSSPTESELADTFEATLTLLYRLLFLLYAEARDLLPIGEAPYEDASLKGIKQEIAAHGGPAVEEAPDRLKKAYTRTGTALYARLNRLFRVMDQGDASLNVPCYNGGLFITQPGADDSREHRIARYLAGHQVPDFYLALAIDRLARDEDEKPVPGATGRGAKLPHGLVFIDYKSLEVRHLGSIYEGLLEFKLKIAQEDLGVTTQKKAEKYIPLSQIKTGRRRASAAEAVVRKGEVYLSNDKAERKVTGSYYTPDPIVEYIVEHTVGPVLAEKLDALRADLRKVGRTFHRHLDNFRANPGLVPRNADARTFAGEKTYAEHKDLVDRLFDFKVLDPAMGSGHFLVEAVDFITDGLFGHLRPRADPQQHSGRPGPAGRDRRRRPTDRCEPAEAPRPQAVHLRRGSQPDGRRAGQGEPLAGCVYAGRPVELPGSPPAVREQPDWRHVRRPEKGHGGAAICHRLRAADAGDPARTVRQRDGRRHSGGGASVGGRVCRGPPGAVGLPDGAGFAGGGSFQRRHGSGPSWPKLTEGKSLPAVPASGATGESGSVFQRNFSPDAAGRRRAPAGGTGAATRPPPRSAVLPLGNRIPGGLLRVS